MASEHDFRTLLKYYENGKLCKPEIQRNYVWKSKQVAGLFDSLYKKYPIGLILLWEPPNEDHLIPLKDQNKTKNPSLAIIDGQQRLTSLHLTKQGQIPVLFNWETEEFAIENPKIKSDTRWIHVSKIWHDDWKIFKFMKELKKTHGLAEDEMETISDRLHTIQKILEDEPTTKVITNEDYEEITKIFIVLNKSGRPIKPNEILFALGILKFPKVFGKKLNDLSQKYDKWHITGARIGPHKFFIQALTCISTQQSKLKDPANTMEKYLHQNKESRILKNFKNIEQGLVSTIQFLEDDLGINLHNNTKLLPSVYPLLLLVNFFVNAKGFALNNEEKALLKLWTFLAMHHNRYSGSSETTLNEDLRTLYQSNLKPVEIIKKWIEEIKKSNGGLEVRSLGSKINNTNMFTLFFALDLVDAKDWFQGTSIRTLQNIEFHHIFPRNFLKGKYSKDEINDPRNIAIVSEKINRKIKDKSPKQYFADQNLIQDKDRIYTQFIPKDSSLLNIQNYKKFLGKRADLIKNELNKYIKIQERKFHL